MDDDGRWTIPWQWEAAGSYRVFADFDPAHTGEGITLSTSVQVAGNYDPAPATGPVTEATVDGVDVAVEGDLVAGSASELTITVTRVGEAGVPPSRRADVHGSAEPSPRSRI